MDKKASGIQLLRDPETPPSDKVLKDALRDSYGAYQTFLEKLPDFGIATEWHYYNDGKSWLGKNMYKKKNLFWLSAWDGFFKITFYFTEKARPGIEELKVSRKIKTQFAGTKPMGRLIALALDIRDEKALTDVYTLIAFKKSLK